jgi:hypothetical protein
LIECHVAHQRGPTKSVGVGLQHVAGRPLHSPEKATHEEEEGHNGCKTSQQGDASARKNFRTTKHETSEEPRDHATKLRAKTSYHIVIYSGRRHHQDHGHDLTSSEALGCPIEHQISKACPEDGAIATFHPDERPVDVRHRVTQSTSEDTSIEEHKQSEAAVASLQRDPEKRRQTSAQHMIEREVRELVRVETPHLESVIHAISRRPQIGQTHGE